MPISVTPGTLEVDGRPDGYAGRDVDEGLPTKVTDEGLPTKGYRQ